MFEGLATGAIFRALFDLENPEICLYRSDPWFFGPQENYERFGDVGNVVFPCGYTLDPDGDRLSYDAAIAPEGTRRRVEGFKSGFYRIALEAGVPILPVALDYREHVVRFLPLVVPQADVDEGVAKMEALFAARGARRH